MSFSSLNFIFILPILLCVYWALPVSARRVWLLLASVVVYMAAGWKDLSLLLLVTSLNWVSHITCPKSKAARIGMILADIFILGWFKYRYFIAVNLGLTSTFQAVVIPLGISFYVFQLISYQVEIMQGILKEKPAYLSFLLYIFFFPHHQAGPIMRPHAFLGSFIHGRPWMKGRFKIGLIIFLWGLFKKIWIADFLVGPKVAAGFALLKDSHGRTGNAFLLAVLYGIQIYADFSGYSDIAVGTGRMFGFKLDRNFHQPYIAAGPSEFWRRWHVTLSQWLRDYIYIPLGGNRKGIPAMYSFLMITMLVGGVWHGAAWSFVLWGFLHGAYLVVERLLARWPSKAIWAKRLLFQALFMLAWLPFREPSLDILKNLIFRSSAWLSPQLLMGMLCMVLIMLFSYGEDWLERHFVAMVSWLRQLGEPQFLLVFHVALFIVLAGVKSETGFIYQRF